MACECNGEWPAAGFFEGNGAAPSVVSIRAHAGCHRHADGVENRGDRARNSADVRLKLPDVVEEGRLDCPRVIRERRENASSYIDGVALIGEGLRPEQSGTDAVEVITDEGLILRTGRFGTNMSEEASDQMAGLVEASGHEAACLHLTQRRTAGRYWMRSSPISVPQVSQIP